MHAAPRRDGDARLRHRRHLDQHLDALRARRARLLRQPPPRRPAQERAPPRAHPHAQHQGPQGRPRRLGLRARRSSPWATSTPATSTPPPRWRARSSPTGSAGAPTGGSSWSTPSTSSARTRSGKHRGHRRDPHARLVALLVLRQLRRALRRGRGSGVVRQGVRAPLPGRLGFKGDGPIPPSPTRCASRRRGATSRRTRRSPATALRPRPGGSDGAHPAEPGVGLTFS